jgi:hypothetical protein
VSLISVPAALDRLRGAESSEEAEPVQLGPRCRRSALLNLRLVHERYPEIRRTLDALAEEVCRHHADDAEADAVECHTPADCRRITAKTLPPEDVARDGHRWSVRAIVRVRQRATERWRGADDIEVVAGHEMCRRAKFRRGLTWQPERDRLPAGRERAD